jgi:hypothetical protein
VVYSQDDWSGFYYLELERENISKDYKKFDRKIAKINSFKNFPGDYLSK